MSADNVTEMLGKIQDFLETAKTETSDGDNDAGRLAFVETGKLAETLSPDLMELVIHACAHQIAKFQTMNEPGHPMTQVQMANYCQDPDHAFLIIYPDASVSKISIENWDPETAEKWAEEHNKWHTEKGE